MSQGKDNWWKGLFGRGGGKRKERVVETWTPESSTPLSHNSPNPSVAEPEDGISPIWQIGEVIQNLYEVREVFEGGGMGLVYRVHHTGWNTDLAVKTPRPEFFATTKHREDFVREAETWVKLGLHPHVVSCYYVRTLGGIPRLFAEYVDGGSLKDWIEDGRLYAGGRDTSLERILDIAIQFAWGLSFAHEQGLVHQDVKPGNVMMTTEGAAKVTDFGLAKARAITGEQVGVSSGKSVVVSWSGRTPAFNSPEQARGLAVSRKTDIWSWGVSVLQMFVGEITWKSGVVAAEALDGYLQTGLEDAAISSMPSGIVDLLRRCFRKDPSARPESMAKIAVTLRTIYEQEVRHAYLRQEPILTEAIADDLNNRALSLLDLGKRDEAFTAWEQALEYDTLHPAATYNRGLALWRSAQMTDQQLLKQLSAISQSNPAHGLRLQIEILLEHGNPETARALLEHQAQTIPDPDLERLLAGAQAWRNIALPDINAFLDLGEAIEPIDLTSDGRQALCASHDGRLRLWDVSTRQCVCTLEGHQAKVESIWLSPNAKRAVSGARDGSVSLWNLETGSLSCRLEGHTDEVTAVCMTADLRWVLSSSQDTSMRIWSADTGHCIQVLNGHDRGVMSLAVTPNGSVAITGSWDRTARLWDLSDGRCLHVLTGHSGSVGAVAIDETGKWSLTGSWDKTSRLWNVETGQCEQIFEGHNARVDSVGICLSAQWAVSSDAGHTLRLWEVATGRCLRTYDGFVSAVATVLLHQIADVSFAPDQAKQPNLWRPDTWRATPVLCQPRNMIIVTETQQQYQQHLQSAKEHWERSEPREAWEYVRHARSLAGYERAPAALELTSQLAHAGRRSGVISAWERLAFRPHILNATCMALSKDGCLALSGYGHSFGNRNRDATLHTWEINSGQKVRFLTECHNNVEAIDLGRFHQIALSGHDDRKLRLWNLVSRTCERTFHGHLDTVRTVCLSNDDRWALSGSDDKTMRLWDVATGRYLRIYEGSGSPVHSVCLSRDSRLALSGSADQKVRLWEVDTTECLHTLEGHNAPVLTVCLSADATMALSGSADATLRLWEVESGRCLRIFEGHSSSINKVCLTADSQWALSGSDDGTIRWWELSTGRCLHVLEGHATPVHSVGIAMDGRRMLSGSEEGMLRLWEIDWNLEFSEADDWEETLKPHLRMFLNMHSPYAESDPRAPGGLRQTDTPTWNANDYSELLEDLKLRGYGWLPSDRLRPLLEQMTRDRGGSWQT